MTQCGSFNYIADVKFKGCVTLIEVLNGTLNLKIDLKDKTLPLKICPICIVKIEQMVSTISKIVETNKLINSKNFTIKNDNPSAIVSKRHIDEPIIEPKKRSRLIINDNDENKKRKICRSIKDLLLEDKELNCKCGCKKKFKTKKTMRMHLYNKYNLFSFRCSQNGCSKGFNNAFALQKHEDSHKGIRKFQCNECSRSYMNKQDLKFHLESKHKQGK